MFYEIPLYYCHEIASLNERKTFPYEIESAPFGTLAGDLPMAPLPAGDELVVRRENILDTRSQSDRRARADAGDLQARLDLIPLSVVEDQLSRCFRMANPECSILSSLRSGDGAAAGHEAAATILEELADSTEQAALTSTLVYRYIQAHSLWRGHPDAKVTSAESFLDTLDNADYVKANIVIGSSADLSKQRSLKAIESRWGADWFGKIPNELRDPRWVRPEECSKRLLGQMTLNVRRGYSLENAIELWTASMQRRTSESARREHKITLPRSPYIILDDVRSLNQTRRPDADAQIEEPESPRQDRLRVELVPPHSPSSAPKSKPDWSATKPTRPPRKRKRPRNDELVVDEDGVEDNDGWRVTANGKEMSKRVGNTLVRKPVDAVDVSESGTPPLTQQPHQRSSPDTQPPSAQPQRLAPVARMRPCDGPSVALFLRKLVDTFREMPALDNDPNAAHGCCETCRPKSLRAFKILEQALLPCAEELENVDAHVFGGESVPTSQITDVSPPKKPLQREHTSLFIESSSDGE